MSLTVSTIVPDVVSPPSPTPGIPVPLEAGRGRWIGIRFPPPRPILTAKQIEAARQKRMKDMRKAIEKQKKALQKARKGNGNNSGLCGLYNLGNTCFLNTAIQCLSFSLPLTEYFHRNLFLRELNPENPLGTKGQLTMAYGKIIQQMWRMQQMEAIEPKHLKATIGKYRPQFSGNQQHDAQEFLSVLLDCLHEDLNRVHKKPYIQQADSDGRPDHVVAKEQWNNYRARDDSIIVDLYTGLLKSSLKFNNCGRVSTTFDPYTSLSLPLPKEKIKHLDITLIYQDLQNRAPRKFTVEFSQRKPHVSAVAATATEANKNATAAAAAELSDEDNEEDHEDETATDTAVTASPTSSSPSTPAPTAATVTAGPGDVSPSAGTTAAAAAGMSSTKADRKTTRQKGMASSTRILDVKYALSRLCGIPVARLQIARLQLSSYDIYKRSQFHFLSNFSFLSEFSLALQNSSGIYGNKLDCYYAFELPVAPPTPVLKPSSDVTVASSNSAASVTTSVSVDGPVGAHLMQEHQQPFQHDGMPNKYLNDSTPSAVPLFFTSPPATSVSLSNSSAQPESAQQQAAASFLQNYSVSYGGVNGFVRLGMKFDVKDSVNKWEIATVKDIRMLIPAQSMRDMGCSVSAEPITQVNNHVQTATNNSCIEEEVRESPTVSDDEPLQENSTAVRFRGDGDCDDSSKSEKEETAVVALDDKKGSEESQPKRKTLIRSASSAASAVRITNADEEDDRALKSEDDTEDKVIHFDQVGDEEEDDEKRMKAAILANLLQDDPLGINNRAGSVEAASRTVIAATPSIEGNSRANTLTHERQPSSNTSSAVFSSSSTTSSLITPPSNLPVNTSRFAVSPNSNFVYQHLFEIPRKLPSDHPVVELYFTFDGFSPKWNEWVSLASPRIAPYGSGLTKTHGRTSVTGAATNPNGAYLTGPPPTSLNSFYGSGLPSGYQFHNPLYTGSVFDPRYATSNGSSVAIASCNGENEVAPEWIRIRVVQRSLQTIPNSNVVDAVNDDLSAASAASPVAVSAAVAGGVIAAGSTTSVGSNPMQATPPNPNTPFDMQFFSIPMQLWLDPHTTTYQQLYEMVWAKVKAFVKIPEWIATPELPALSVKNDAVQPPQKSDDEAVDVAQVKFHLNPTVEQEVAAGIAPNQREFGTLSSPLGTTPTSSYSSSSSPSSASKLPPCFNSFRTAPFSLRFTNHSGTQCSKCITWGKQCLGCAMDLHQPTIIDPPIVGVIGGGNFALHAPTFQRDVTLINSHHRRSMREWYNDCTITLDWNTDYITCNLIDIDQMGSIELDESCVRFRAREQSQSHKRVDLNVCMSMFTSTEKLEGDAAVYCSKCKTHESATKTLELYSTPPILVLHLKRLLPDTKLYTEVQFPLEGFNPRPFLSSQTAAHSSPVKPAQPAEEKQSSIEKVKVEAETDKKVDVDNDNHDKAIEAEPPSNLEMLNAPVISAGSSSASSVLPLRIEVTQASSEPSIDDDKASAASSNFGDNTQVLGLAVPQPRAALKPVQLTPIVTNTVNDAASATNQAQAPSRSSTPSRSPSLISASAGAVLKTAAPSAAIAPPVRPFTPVGGGFDASAPASSQIEDLYDLYAVVNHHGAVGGGHYLTYCLDRRQKQWYRFDDSRVTKIDRSMVVTNSAYMLFYERRGLKTTAGVDACPAQFDSKSIDASTRKLIKEFERDTDACAAACSIQ